MKRTLFVTMAIAFLTSISINIFAQNSEIDKQIKPLKIGDQIPDDLWNLSLKVVNEPSGKREVTLEQFKGKLILLDFWGTYCSSCIAGFPKLKAIQEQNQDKVKILAISSEKREKLDKFFRSEIGREHSHINSVYEDTIVKKYFPHRGIPHIIWISPEGKYVLPTNSYEVTQENVDAIYSSQEANILKKVDVDRNLPLLLSENFFLNGNLSLGFYSLFFQGYYPGYPSGSNFKKTENGKTYGRQTTNQKLSSIIRMVAMHLFEEYGEHFSEKRIILNAKNSYLLDRNQKIPGKIPNEEYYSYELIVPKKEADSLYTYMLADLNRYLDVKLILRKQMTNCLVLVRTSKQDKIKSKGNSSGRRFEEKIGKLEMKNEPFLNLISLLNEIPLSQLPIIDETGYTNNIDLNLNGFNNLAELRKSLAKYDLDLRTATRDLLMFVITDKNRGS